MVLATQPRVATTVKYECVKSSPPEGKAQEECCGKECIVAAMATASTSWQGGAFVYRAPRIRLDLIVQSQASSLPKATWQKSNAFSIIHSDVPNASREMVVSCVPHPSSAALLPIDAPPACLARLFSSPRVHSCKETDAGPATLAAASLASFDRHADDLADGASGTTSSPSSTAATADRTAVSLARNHDCPKALQSRGSRRRSVQPADNLDALLTYAGDALLSLSLDKITLEDAVSAQIDSDDWTGVPRRLLLPLNVGETVDIIDEYYPLPAGPEHDQSPSRERCTRDMRGRKKTFAFACWCAPGS